MTPKYMSKEERVAHVRAAAAVLDDPTWQLSLEAFLNNLDQLTRDLTRGETDALSFMITQFVSSTATVARLLALGIDPASAQPTDEEIAEMQAFAQKSLPRAKIMPYMGGRPGKGRGH